MSNIHTIIIAPTTHAAMQEARYLYLKGKYPDGLTPAQVFAGARLPGFCYVSAAAAVFECLAHLPRRIVIVDYPRWQTAPGGMTALWQRICYLRDHNGTEIVWR